MQKIKVVMAAVALGALLSANASSAAVLFSDNFDGHADWSPRQSTTGATTTCMQGANCTSPVPTGFNDYRVAATVSCSNLDGLHNTLNINGQHPRGQGKSFMMWNEPCYSSSGSWGSDGLLGIAFAPQQEVYVRAWALFPKDWKWNTTSSPMQKFIHLSHYDATNTASVWDFFSGTQNKPRYVGGYAKYGSGTYRTQLYMMPSPLTATRDNSASTTTNDFLGASPLDWYNTAAPGDGEWHSMEWYVKLNSAGGIADGKARFWLDGRLVHDQSNVVWIPAGDNPSSWQWNHVWLGGNNANTYTPASEQWYALDDLVVSTTYSGPPAQPTSVTAAAGAANTVNLRWSAGSNGVAYPVNGYRIYYGKDVANLNMKVDVGNVLQYNISSLDPATKYYFVVSAYNKGSYDSNDNEGVRSVTASATTVSGTTTTTTADAVAPVASISSPATGSTVSGNVTINVAASDNVAVSKVEMYLNGSILGVVGSAPYTLTWNTANSPNATYTLTAKAYDAAGNVGQTSSSVTVKNAVAVTDASAPVISSFTMPASATSLTVPVTAFAASDDVGVTGYQITESATAPVAGATTWKTSAPTSCTFSAAGSRTAYAWCKDASGRVSAAKTALVNITTATTTTGDTAAPVVSITSPVTGSTVKGTVTVSANATDNVGVKKVEFYVNGVLRVTSTTAPYVITWNTANYPNGSNTMTVKAYDAAGNVGQSSVTVNVFNDKTAPTINVASPLSYYMTSGTLYLKASATDNVAVTKLQVYVDNVLVLSTSSSSLNTSKYVTIGRHAVIFKAYDAANNVTVVNKSINRLK